MILGTRNDKINYKEISKLLLPYIIIVSLISLFFSRSFTYGLQFDNVFRINNILPLLNQDAIKYNQSISNLNIGGYSIPLMYKNYISSIQILKYLPLVFFNDYYLGFKIINFIYFVIYAVGIYILLKVINKRMAIIVSIYIISNPIIYPMALFNFVRIDHIFLTLLSIYLIYLFMYKERKKKYLFWGSFILSFSANLYFYNIWTIAAIFLTSIIFFYHEWRTILDSYKEILISVCGFSLGFFNYIYFNVSEGFPSLKPLIFRFFNAKEYNKVAIDYVQVTSFSDEFNMKLRIFKGFFGDFFHIYIFIFISLLFLYLLILYIVLKTDKLKENRLFFLPLITTFFLFTFIMISPNAKRPEHFNYLSPFLELSIISPIIFLYKSYNRRKLRKLLLIFTIFILVVNIVSSYTFVRESNENKGTGYYSRSVLDLNSYIIDNDINSENTLHTQWGMYAQLYFLNKGMYNINSLVFQLKEKKTDIERYRVLDSYFQSIENNRTIYIPLYSFLDNDISTSVLSFFKNNKAKIEKIVSFSDTNGIEVIDLYKLKMSSSFISNLGSEYKEAVITNELRIKKFGPRQVKLKELKKDDYGMWLITEGHTRDTKVMLNDITLKTVYYEDHLTALVEKKHINEIGRYEVSIFNYGTKEKSKPVYLIVNN